MSLKEPLSFREATIADLKSIMNVENAAFTVPWTEAAFRNEFIINQYAYYILATYNDEVVGYAGIWLVLDEGHVTNIAIHPDYQGNHYGEALLREMIRIAKDCGVIRITLEVRVSNDVAQGLYKKLGFQNGAIRKNYYPDTKEDALVMWVDL
ncbi:ribosomal protein S18-alanine N-acetyltransferase [Listeria ivanovii]|uniref:[Ribosomal protein bS18]-alanine N-acetyltransferase n=1 Tax=Listeria ivanovii subsp. londoniensis TaxID=202752 RepID=A0ABS1G735_LISIV|nr:ribosomal protein S18-alanine N-acetyltransferase [Listeria ivanovii]AIS60484.1 alanine acetyltransferase [Listeria ivanovii subsp. londoniensis]AIS63309.1 alanine acetyltransferase [Listeria ivanovii subsp. londoniensis]MBK1962661.1 ribosomal protein S18-alanine N-acetyltransferase [Listeria ivanovii subsp. londoniensis]MBK1966376.1 ribosomal protein S18-alanine N-acetyltransferase [Listeria ivanovii subsp. londoniensis]MBK1983585.1 ribosomal protein S18-alanine N-acetyltransferase [Lister